MTTVMTAPAVVPLPRRSADERVRLRPAGPDDVAALHAMFRRCGPQSRYDRFHGVVGAIPARYLAEAVAGRPERHDALVVEVAPADGSGPVRLVALGSARLLDRPGTPRAELGLLVEDRWQGRGLGEFLLTTLAARAAARGVGELECSVLQHRRRLLDVVDRSLGPVAVRSAGLTLEALVRLPERPAGSACGGPAPLWWRAP
jgi:GNAT superfamily N-acetyltransferase